MVISFKATVKGTGGVVRSMGRVVAWANMELPQLTFEESQQGARIASLLAPQDTGALVNAIGTRPSSRGKGFSVVSRIPKGKNSQRTKPRAYHMFMHGIKAKSFPLYNTGKDIKNGDPRYMFTTANIMRREYPKKVLNSLRKKIK